MYKVNNKGNEVYMQRKKIFRGSPPNWRLKIINVTVKIKKCTGNEKLITAFGSSATHSA